MNDFWDNRYSSEEFVYGTAPNEYFKSEINKLSPGRLLTLAEGEGRNGIYAASLGWEVDAVDFSSVAREKALKLASEKNLKINYTVSDLSEFYPPLNTYDAVSIIFMHLNPDLASTVHKRAIEALKRGGKIIMEVYDKEQLGKNSGGPQDPDMLYSIDRVKQNFKGLKIEYLKKEIVQIYESKYHHGESAVIRFIGVKP
jgi:SAM-dependent methyltransferase